MCHADGKIVPGKTGGFLEGINYRETGLSIRRVTEDATEREEGRKDCLIGVKKEADVIKMYRLQGCYYRAWPTRRGT